MHMLIDQTASYAVPGLISNASASDYLVYALPIQVSTNVGDPGAAVIVDLAWNDDQARTHQIVYGLNDPTTDVPFFETVLVVVAPSQTLDLTITLIPAAGAPGYRFVLGYLPLL